jgi:drug/metabolite transporter (DMT)-like permease
MIVERFSEFGLAMATIASLGNVVGELLRKQIMLRQNATAVTFAYRALSTVFALITLVVVVRTGTALKIVDGGTFFGAPFLSWSPGATFAGYIVVLVAILGYASWAHLKAFQLSAISTTVPLLSFTPVFTIFTGWIGFGEVPSWTKVLGIVLIVAGTFAIHIDVLSSGWLEPLKAVVVDAGSRYMLAVALLYAVAGPIEKRVVLMTGPFAEALAYAFGTAALFLVMSVAFRVDPLKPFRQEPWTVFWLSVSDIVVLITQYVAAALMPVVVGISLKRAGTIVIVALGWFYFKERGISRKLLGSAIMVVGVLLIYFAVTFTQALVSTVIGLAILVPLAIRARRIGGDPLPEPAA